ncbi:hypothetical protein LXA43DRAFT_1107928 [Ganoderma leucocontextum]|nr:hypothetical protein LXA43DRAFT_1107928 [Ganoderma leucocontextum]
MPIVVQDHVQSKASYAADLPRKVLQTIFEVLRAEHHCTDTRDHGFLSPWIPATWVSRHWRAVALATPHLWSWIDINGRHCDPDAIATLLTRSGDEDLSVSLDGQAMDMVAGCAMALPVAPRISHLSMCMEEAHAPLVEELLRHVGERLGTLQVYCEDEAQERGIALDPTQVPNLRTLSVRNIFVHPTAELRGLKDLTLEQMWDVNVNGRMDVGEYVYGMLAVCPDLETLDIEDALPHAASVEVGAYPQITFKKLRWLWVSELAADLPANLAKFVVPPSANVNITARYDGCLPESFETATVIGKEHEQDSNAVLPMNTFPTSKFENFPSLADTMDLSLRLGTPCSIGDIHIEGGKWQVTIPSLDDERRQMNRLPELLEHVYTAFPTAFIDPSKIVFLELHIAEAMPEYDGWAEMLAQFPNVAALTIGGRNALNEVVIALKGNGKGSNGSGNLLPKLMQLTACLAVRKTAVTKGDARAFGMLLKERAAQGKMLASLMVRVPDSPLNKATVHLASALVAYMAVRGARARVVKKDCPTCHGVEAHHHEGYFE